MIFRWWRRRARTRIAALDLRRAPTPPINDSLAADVAETKTGAPQ